MNRSENRFTKSVAVEQSYKKLLASKKNKWTAANYIMAIKRHHGVEVPPKGETSLEGKNANAIKRIYESKYKNQKPPTRRIWTPAMEAKLSRYKRGEINSVEETALYGQAVKLNEDYIVLQLKNVSELTRLRAMQRLYNDLEEDARKRVIDSLLENTCNADYIELDDPDDEENSNAIDSDDEENSNDVDVIDANGIVDVEDDAQGLLLLLQY